MALCRISFPAKSIGLNTGMNVIVPDEGSGPFPVLYQLHGLSDDQDAWLRRTSIERYVAPIPLIVVLPTTGRGWYTNAADEPRRAYEDHFIKDVVPWVDRVFPTIKSRQGRVIGGLSMGGYGAVKLALKYPQMFCSAASHSGAVMTPLYRPETRPTELLPLVPEFEGIFGKDWRGGPNDPVALAKSCPKDLRPALRLDCGAADFLLQQNREFHAVLESIGYPHDYVEFPATPGWQSFGPLNPWTGAHDWNCWDYAVQHAIVFHCKALGIAVPVLTK